MRELNDILKYNGEDGVKKYRQSLEQNDRVATGKTKNSIRFEVKNTSLIFYALDHIRDLEEGQTASQIKSKGNFFDQLQEWVEARGIGGSKQLLVSHRIFRSLNENGWNTTRSNRTGQNGGTKGIITDVDKEVTKNVLNDIKKGSKSIILEEIRASRNAFNNSQ